MTMGNFGLLILLLVGLWLYARCRDLVIPAFYDECLQDVELTYVQGAESAKHVGVDT